jgi:hypothetical protein
MRLHSLISLKMEVFSMNICTGQILHLYKTKWKIIILCGSISMFLDGVEGIIKCSDYDDGN